uniref:Uncharacterized protein n=1 Tax=uncultured Candidatus Melainabacteria bacterium TaxID=2682970 RepID=A0A650EJF2_9BACT|nr:hypothetical protein Melaina855_0530 [uncultured Candidatus Melainabacteria bacterium]
MLSQTIRSNLKDINNLKMRTKATKFSSLFQSAPTEIEKLGKEFRQVLMKDGLIEVEDDSLFDEIPAFEEIPVADEDYVTDEEVLEYIVENPNEVVVEFPIISNLQLDEKLPFFRSLSLKLANI